jgi:hypothetical protein
MGTPAWTVNGEDDRWARLWLAASATQPVAEREEIR